MNFMQLNSEFEKRQIYSNQTMRTLGIFQTFFATLHKSISHFSTSTQKALQIVFSDLIQYDNDSSLSKHFFEFYRSFDVFLTKARQISEKISYELVQPIELINLHLNDKNLAALTELKEVINSVSEQKRQYEISKHNYFDACKTAEKQEERVIQVLNDNDKNKTVNNQLEAEKAHNLLVEYRTIAENNCQKYKETLMTTNEHFEIMEKRYSPIVQILRNNEESRRNFLKYHLEKLDSFIEDFQKSLMRMITSFKETAIDINIDDDLLKYDAKYSQYSHTSQRISKETFLRYDIYRRQVEALLSSNIQMFKKAPINASFDKLSSLNANLNVISMDQKNFSFEEKEEKVIVSLFNEEIINKKEMALFNLKLRTKQWFAKDFIRKLQQRCNSSVCIKVEHLDKLIAVCECLANVAMNESLNKEWYETHLAIVFIAEGTFFELPTGQRLYLTRALTDLHSLFKSKSFWKRMLEMYMSSEVKQNKQSTEKDRTGFFNASLLKSTKVNEESKNKTLKKEVNFQDVAHIIKDFLIHLGNFSVDSGDINDILIESIEALKLNTLHLSFLITCSNSNLHSIRARRYNSKPSIIKPQGNLLFLQNKSSLDQNFLKKKAFKSQDFQALAVLLNACKYLSHKEYIWMVCLSRSYYQKTSKYIYQSLLWNHPHLSFSSRLIIWKNALQYVSSSTPSYQTLHEASLDYSTPLYEVINVDIIRTSFEINQEANRLSTSNILKTLAYQHKDIGYCQGMNYIAGFLVTLTENETQAFEAFNSLLSKTAYGRIVSDDFALLKKYFYVFDRLLVIFLPEVANFLQRVGLSASYYITPWFITLFTSSISYLPKGETPLIVIRIFDLFVLKGWNAVINVSLCLMKYYERSIITMKFDELLQFLINNAVKFDFFYSNNYEAFINSYNKLKVSSGLISNLENEYEQELKLLANQQNK